MAVAQAQAMAENRSFPNEILELVVSHIGVPYTQHERPYWTPYDPCEPEQNLKQISLVSSAFAAACQPYLFQTVVLIFDIAFPRRPDSAQNPARYERLQESLARSSRLHRYIKRLQVHLSYDNDCVPGPDLDQTAGNANDLSAQAALRVMAGLKNLEHVSVAGRVFRGGVDVPPAIQQALTRCFANNNILALELSAAAYPVTLLRGFGPCLDALSLDWTMQSMKHEAHEDGTACTTVAPRRLSLALNLYWHHAEAYAPLLSTCTTSLFSRVEEIEVMSSEMNLRTANGLLWRTAATVKHIHLSFEPYCPSDADIIDPIPVPQNLQLPRLTTFHLEVTRRWQGHPREEPDVLFHYLRHPAFQRITSFKLTHHYPLHRMPLPPGVADLAEEEPPKPLDCGGWDRIDEVLADERVFQNLSEVVLEYSNREEGATYAHTRREAEALLPLTRARVRRFAVRFVRKPGWF